MQAWGPELTPDGRLKTTKEMADAIVLGGTAGAGAAAAPPVPASHIVFVLDESGSMSGTPFQQLTAAYQQFILGRRGARGGQGPSLDIVSTVMFGSSARSYKKHQPLSSITTELTFASGSTNFGAGLSMALEHMTSAPAHYSPTLIFMSDGYPDTVGSGEAEMTSIFSRFKARGLQVHTVAFGTSAAATLTKLAQLGGGKFHQALTGVDLMQTFTEISLDSTLQSQLVEEFGSKLAKMVSTKLVLDYL